MANHNTKKLTQKVLKIISIVVAVILVIAISLVGWYMYNGLGSDSLKVESNLIDGHIEVRYTLYMYATVHRFYYVSPSGWHYLLFEETGPMVGDDCMFIEKYYNRTDEEVAADIRIEHNKDVIIWWEDDDNGYTERMVNVSDYGLFPWYVYVVSLIIVAAGVTVIIFIVKKKKHKE